MATVVTPPRGPLGPMNADHTRFVSGKMASTCSVAALAKTEIFYNDTDMPLNITSTRATVGTAPTAASLIVDVFADGTSIFATTTANRPTITAGAFTAAGGTPDTTVLAAGKALTFSILQVGSSVAGADLNIQVGLRP